MFELIKKRQREKKLKANKAVGLVCSVPGCTNKIDAQGRYFGHMYCKGHRHLYKK